MTAPARPLPEPGELTWDQSAGRACIWCKRPLTSGAVSAGIICDQLGAHNLDTEVWAGPCCASTTH
ncbi:hypothetical protein ACWD7C_28875 [Streptomyces sp. NPDC005134]|uniref:hypothetical protein n=1 Tax=unclassified Streptomyces TaxID=2593676 RepID=UPI0033A35F47